METVLNRLNSIQQRFEVGEPTHISFARRAIGELALSIGFSEDVFGRLRSS